MIFCLFPEIRYGIGLLEQLEEPGCIITSHKHDAVPIIRDQGFEVFCLEEEGLEPLGQAHQMLEVEAVRAMIIALPIAERKIITFKITPRLEKLAQELQATVLLPSFKLNRFWEDKNKGMAELAKLQIPVKPSIDGAFQEINYRAITEGWNWQHLVVQKPRGMAGSTTYFVNDEKEWNALGPTLHNTLVKITPYIEGKPYTVNCCVNDTGIYHGYPMYQITGDKRFTRYAGGTCGVDMTGGRIFPEGFLNELDQIVGKIGQTLKGSGFWGWFGIDFLVSVDDKITVLEINPRFTASISIFSQYQSALFAGSFWQGTIDRRKQLANTNQPLSLTTLIIRNTASENIILKNSLAAGVYEQQGDTCVYAMATIFVSDLCALFPQPNYLIVAKTAGTEILPDGEIATIVTPRSATDSNGDIDEDLSKVADWVKSTLFIK